MSFPVRIIIQGFCNEPVEISVLDSGNVCCPVCGIELETRGLVVVAFLFGATETCPCCRTSFGISDIDEVPPIRENPAAKRWEKLRTVWLTKNNWDRALIKQVEDHLGVEIVVPPVE
jgi:hypothetical protein